MTTAEKLDETRRESEDDSTFPYKEVICQYFTEHGKHVSFCPYARVVTEDINFGVFDSRHFYKSGQLVCLKTCGGCEVPVEAYVDDTAIGAYAHASIPLTNGRTKLKCSGGRTVKIELSD